MLGKADHRWRGVNVRVELRRVVRNLASILAVGVFIMGMLIAENTGPSPVGDVADDALVLDGVEQATYSTGSYDWYDKDCDDDDDRCSDPKLSGEPACDDDEYEYDDDRESDDDKYDDEYDHDGCDDECDDDEEDDRTYRRTGAGSSYGSSDDDRCDDD